MCGGGTVGEKKRSVCLSQAALNIAIQVREYHKAISFLKLSVAVRRQFVKKINGVAQTTKQTVLGPVDEHTSHPLVLSLWPNMPKVS